MAPAIVNQLFPASCYSWCLGRFFKFFDVCDDMCVCLVCFISKLSRLEGGTLGGQKDSICMLKSHQGLGIEQHPE